MNSIWIASMVLQWALLLALCLLALSLMRQLGKLNLSRNHGPAQQELYALFTELPIRAVKLFNGEIFRFGGVQRLPCLLVFFSAKCGACEQLPGAVKDFVEKNPPDKFTVLVILDAERIAAERFIAAKSLSHVPIALLEDFPESNRPEGVPYGVAITAEGKVAARGKPRYILHLLEMADAVQYMIGVAARKHEWGESVPHWEPGQQPAAPAARSAAVI